MKSTPKEALEKATGIHPIADRCDIKVLTQSAKFKRMPDHPMKERMKGNTKRRIQKSNFLQKSRKLEAQSPDLKDDSPQEISRCLATPAWRNNPEPTVKTTIPGIGPKSSQDTIIRRALALEHLDNNYPLSDWVQVYTDDSAVRNGGAGIYIRYPNDQEDRHQLPTGAHSSNYKAEVEAIKKAAEILVDNTFTKMVILRDTLSVLQALEEEDKNLNYLSVMKLLC